MGWHIRIRDLVRQTESIFSSDDAEVRIGRDHFWANLCLDEDLISRRHIILYTKDKSLFMEDLQSKNGSFLSEHGRWNQVVGHHRLTIPVELVLSKRFQLGVDFSSHDTTVSLSVQRHAKELQGQEIALCPLPPLNKASEETMLYQDPSPMRPEAKGMGGAPANLRPPPPVGNFTNQGAPPRPPTVRKVTFAPLPTGEVLVERYQLENLLGQGSFAFTYLARDLKLQRQVAVKEYFPTTLLARADGKQAILIDDLRRQEFRYGLEKFLYEAQLLAGLNHANLVQVFDHFACHNTAYYVMAYEDGNSLESVAHPNKRVPEHYVVKILFPLMAGLEVVHHGGLVHRDVKPANIYLRKSGGPVLLDFGAARYVMPGSSEVLTSMFSPGYAPFEQYDTNPDRQGPWTDVYALGAVAYRLMTGKVPVSSQLRAACVYGQMPDPLEPLASLAGSQYSQRLQTAVNAALNYEPKQRPQSIAEWRKIFTMPG